MYSRIYSEFLRLNVPAPELITTLTLVSAALLAVLILKIFLKKITLPMVVKISEKSTVTWDDTLLKHRAATKINRLICVLVFIALIQNWLAPVAKYQQIILLVSHLYLLYTVAILLFAFINAGGEIYKSFTFARQIPINVFMQVFKILIILFVIITGISIILDQSPALLLSSLGAMTAIIMLIFKDPILGFMAGIQLSANRMLAVGDWLEMPKYDANGDVIDITLTTVKVQNWDNTITTVPTYALISDSFKNWRGMQETGGRRISRSILIDISSIHFLSDEECTELRKNPRIKPFIPPAAAQISTKEHTKTSPCDTHQNMTNSHVFRRYLTEYIRSHPAIHPGLIQMVRLLQPTAQGLPVQIYAFAAKTDWISYEKIQSDIFDHILAVAPEFNLTLFQNPAGRDIRSLLAASKSGEKS